MTITKVDLKSGSKQGGANESGNKIYLVGSDTNIGDDIDVILDASVVGGNGIPAYNSVWGAGDGSALLVANKGATSWDMSGETMEGYWWRVDVEYTPDGVNDNDHGSLPPEDWDWEWDIGEEERSIQIPSSEFDTSGYVYPGSDSTHMVNLDTGEAFTNTAGDPAMSGVEMKRTRDVITLVKYVKDTSWAGIGTGLTSREDVNLYRDSLNDANFTLLGTVYPKWTLWLKSIKYKPVVRNGKSRVKVTFKIVCDEAFTHVFTYPSAGLRQVKVAGEDPVPIKSKGQNVTKPMLLDRAGLMVPQPASSPYIKTAFYVSGGTQVLRDWSVLLFPATYP